MSEAKPTPGPWASSQMESGGWKVYPANDPNFKICRIDNAITYLMDFDEAARPDANLIAAAPDLLAALKGILKTQERWGLTSVRNAAYNAAVDAIAKAEGRSMPSPNQTKD